MIAFSRTLARQFRAVLRRSLLDKEPRGSWPLVLFQASKDGLVLQACQSDTAVRYHLDGSYLPEAIAFRSSVLAEVEGRRDDHVELEQVAFGKGQAKWVDGDVPKVTDLETVAPDSVPDFPDLPKRFTPMPREFLQALDEATKTAARESVRYALARLQLRGKTGEIIATDGRQLLVQGGFTFPWSDTVLVPRVPAFGLRELAQEPDVSVGRTKTHVAVRVGPWTFLLAIDTQSRFPDVEAVIPRVSSGVSRLHLDPQDAAFLTANVPKLPGSEENMSPVTLDLHAPISLRGRDEKHGITELVLNRSTVSGPPVRLSMDRRYLVRAVKLGFDKVEISSADKPLVCRADQRLYVWMPLDKTAVILSEPGMQRISSAEGLSPPTSSEPERRESPMPAPQPNGPTS